MKCTARVSENLNNAMGAEEFLRALLGPWIECPSPATWRTPLGPRCEACADRLFNAARQPDTILGILLLEKEKRGAPTDRDAMRKASTPIQ